MHLLVLRRTSALRPKRLSPFSNNAGATREIFIIGVTVICNTVWHAIISFINSHLLRGRRHTRSSSHVQRIHSFKTLLESASSGIDCTHNMCSIARDPSLSDRQPASCVYVWAAWCNSNTRREWGRKREVRFHWLANMQHNTSRNSRRITARALPSHLESVYISKCCHLLRMHHLCVLQCFFVVVVFFFFYLVESELEYCNNNPHYVPLLTTGSPLLTQMIWII